MKSFIPWIGGKTLLAKKITAEFPQGSSSQDFGRYIEVFGGGVSVLFSADRHAKFEVYNDANGDLVNLFRCIKYHREELQKEIRYYLYTLFSFCKGDFKCCWSEKMWRFSNRNCGFIFRLKFVGASNGFVTSFTIKFWE